jgi:nucleoside-triphosphatase THEP1
MADRPSSCIILTGPLGSGKTVELRSALGSLAASGRDVAAVIQPGFGRGPDGLATSFAMELLLSSGDGSLSSDRFPLARELAPGEEVALQQAAPQRQTLGRFVFETGAFARAEAFVQSALDTRSSLEVFGLDELGRLELRRREGLRPCLDLALAALAASEGRLALICAAREDCLPELRDLARSIGLKTETIRPPRSEEAIAGVLRALGL